MLKAVQNRIKERERLLKESRGYLLELRKKIGPLSGFVYGSVARGDFNDASDIDIIIIAENLPEKILDRLELLSSIAKPGIEPKGYTYLEFKKLKKKKNNYLSYILNEAVVVLDDLGIL